MVRAKANIDLFVFEVFGFLICIDPQQLVSGS
jgi:hypothetical protein